MAAVDVRGCPKLHLFNVDEAYFTTLAVVWCLLVGLIEHYNFILFYYYLFPGLTMANISCKRS